MIYRNYNLQSGNSAVIQAESYENWYGLILQNDKLPTVEHRACSHLPTKLKLSSKYIFKKVTVVLYQSLGKRLYQSLGKSGSSALETIQLCFTVCQQRVIRNRNN